VVRTSFRDETLVPSRGYFLILHTSCLWFNIWLYIVTTPLEYCWKMGHFVLVCSRVILFLSHNQKATGYIFPINDYLSDYSLS